MNNFLTSTAQFSPCGQYRYRLERQWNPGSRTLNIIGLNPSTADATHNDPTIRRCIDFAQRWGYDRLHVTNVFAFRATQPKDLFAAPEPEGPDNTTFLLQTAQHATAILFAWGNHGHDHPATHRLIDTFPHALCLGHTKIGAPRHPLYIRKDQLPLPFK